MSYHASKHKEGMLLLSGLCVFMAFMLGYPAVANIWYSLSNISFSDIHTSEFVGLVNFENQLFSPKMWKAMGFSLQFGLICAALEVVLALLLVFTLHPILSRRPWLTAFLMLPMMVSPALMGVMYRLMLNEFAGVVPLYFEMFGVYVNFLGPENIYTTVIVIEVLQWTPFALLILLAARQAVSPDIEEAANMDGAKPLQLIRFIFLPAMLPAIVIVAFIRFIDSFRVFDHIFVLTGGGPGSKTTSISIYIYKLFFNQNAIGEAVAVSLILLFMSLILFVMAAKLIFRSE